MRENIEEDIKRLEEISEYINYSMWRDDTNALRHILSDYKRVLKENEELIKITGSKCLVRRYFKMKDNSIPIKKITDILNEINKEYIKQEEIFNKHFEKENRDMQDYYIQKEATNIMQELSWVEGKLQELLERNDTNENTESD